MAMTAHIPYTELVKRDNDLPHHSYAEEVNMLQAVQRGDLAEALRCYAEVGHTGGILSEDAARNGMYHFVAFTTLVTRYCIEGGLAPELAYMLSDLYIQRADICQTAQERDALRGRMLADFTGRMSLLRGVSSASPAVLAATTYIFRNLERKLTVSELAFQVGLSASRLSHLFADELGMTIGEYIRQQRVEAAKELLCFSSMSASEIAAQLAFSSQSHFISVFRKSTGMTPGEYAARHTPVAFGGARRSDQNTRVRGFDGGGEV